MILGSVMVAPGKSNRLTVAKDLAVLLTTKLLMSDVKGLEEEAGRSSKGDVYLFLILAKPKGVEYGRWPPWIEDLA